METQAAESAPSAEALAMRVKMDGYVLLDERLPLATVDRLRDRFDELLAERQAARSPNRGANRYQMHLPFAPPFADPQIYENSRVLEVLEALIGPDPICTYYASDTPLPGSEYQRVHTDTRLLFPETSLSLPCYGVVLNIPLVDVCEENGPLELWPGGSHLMPGRLDIPTLAPQMQSIRLTMPAGSMLLRDLRVWHRGTPNRSARSRPNLALVYTRPWYRFEQPPIEIPESAYCRLSDRARAMFRYNVLVEG